MPRKKHSYHYLYKTTNLINNKYYYGMHSTSNLNDGYLGSGTYLRRSIRKYGKENFKLEIIKFFDSREELANAEKKLVTTDLIKEKLCMNLMLGGEYFNNIGKVVVKDLLGNILQVNVDDERYLSGELIQISKGKVVCVNKTNHDDIIRMDITDARYISEEYLQLNKIFTTVKDIDGNYYYINKDDERYKSGELVNKSKGKIIVKDINNNYFSVDKTDERYLSGELLPFFTGQKHTKKTRDKISIIEKSKVWIYNDILCKTKRVIPSRITQFINDGWLKGFKKEYNNPKRCGKYSQEKKEKIKLNRKCKPEGMKNKIFINDGNKNKIIFKEEIDNYIIKGWFKGRIQYDKEPKCVINNGLNIKYINIKDIENFINDGWLKGGLKNK